jgi:hypothetical protein
LIVAKEFSMRYDIMFFPIGFTLQDSNMICSYVIYSYESNRLCIKISIGCKSYESKEPSDSSTYKNRKRNENRHLELPGKQITAFWIAGCELDSEM